MKRIQVLFLIIILKTSCVAQIDSIAKALVDTVKSKLIVDDIPKKTFKDVFMYPHRWYVRLLLSPKKSAYDTSYIKSSKHKLTITIPLVKKFYGFNITDITTKKTLKLSPNNYYYLGFNFSNVIATVGFYPGIKFGSKPNRGKTSGKDFQLTLIGTKIITDINYQTYSGFYVYNTKDYEISKTNSDTIVIRPDINIYSFGVNTMYVLNNKKYSLRGAFSFTDVQRKSAGSFMAGLYHSYVTLFSNDTTFIKHPLTQNFSPLLSKINKITQVSLGLSGGYGYTYVYKKIIFSAAVNIGLGGQKTSYNLLEGKKESLKPNVTVSLNAKNAIRYDNLRFFVGVLTSYDNNLAFNSSVFNNEKYIARIVGFVGYRFNIKQNGKKVLKAMGLIDYEKK
ncbi:MAG: DUF4421 family protein [Bacteroidia bacterium]